MMILKGVYLSDEHRDRFVINPDRQDCEARLNLNKIVNSLAGAISYILYIER